jgi:hypothetical protein
LFTGSTFIDDLAFAAGPACPGDLNGDGAVGLSDLTILLAHFGAAGGAGSADGDLDGDGDVDLSDLTAFLAASGKCAAERGSGCVSRAGALLLLKGLSRTTSIRSVHFFLPKFDFRSGCARLHFGRKRESGPA